MTKIDPLGGPVFPDLKVDITLTSRKDTVKVLSDKLRFLSETAYGESEVLIYRSQSTQVREGSLIKCSVSQSWEVYFPKK